VVEKILGQDEALRPSWPVAGTTGYEWVGRITRQLTDPAGEAPLRAIHARITGEERAFADLARTAKLEVLTDDLGSELGRLTSLLLDVLERHRRHRDHTRHDLHEALRELIACLPIYRTYVRPPEPGGSSIVTTDDEASIGEAIAAAQQHRSDLPADLFEAIGDLLLFRLGTSDLEAEFVARFQQLTGPATAKGVEDTAVYRDLRLLALDEVGVDPSRWCDPTEALHAAAARAQDVHPAAMLTTSTHDTKRSEDVRARSLVLSTIPDRWAERVDAWLGRLSPVRDPLVDGAASYLVLQTLVAAWPIEETRLQRYVEKALRETKLRTSWTAPDAAYESAVRAFVHGALGDAGVRREVESFVTAELLVPGRINALAQVLLKLTLPGVPDIYQGNELWDLSLVDPDNRRPVDLELRASLLPTLASCTPEALRASLDDPADPGLAKLWLTHRALDLRARRAQAFGETAGYAPLDVRAPNGGAAALAYARLDEAGEPVVAVVVPRPSAAPGRGPDPAVTVALPDGAWLDVVTDARVAGGVRPLPDLLTPFPVALLERAR
jgi:(1->4)-alpha-D-glucan 1-alpha-D-glucosylmutase